MVCELHLSKAVREEVDAARDGRWREEGRGAGSAGREGLSSGEELGRALGSR